MNIPSKLLSQTYYRGFTPAVMWSPFFASVGIVIHVMQIQYLHYMIVGTIFAFVQIIIGIFVLRPKDNGKAAFIQYESVSKPYQKNINLLVFSVIFLITWLSLLEVITKQSMLLLVCINCLFLPFMWMIFRKKWGEMYNELKTYKKQITEHSNMEIGLFLSAGLFGNALLHTPIMDVLKNAIIWSSKGSIILLFIFIIGLVTLMAAIGIHQIIVIPLILMILLSPEVHVNALTSAFMCIFSWMLSASISPLNALNIIISQCVRENGLKVALNWNGKYFLTITGLAFVYAYLLSFFSGV